ncbi:hypothetical protein [Chroococcidiopsis sp.]|uniref:hypothetical protein n=1 Tax=Chroococcidiopsis sp. TaxID=3088168 RepID=UPI003F3062A5
MVVGSWSLVQGGQGRQGAIQNSKLPDSLVRAGFEQRLIDVSRDSFAKPAPTTLDSRLSPGEIQSNEWHD